MKKLFLSVVFIFLIVLGGTDNVPATTILNLYVSHLNITNDTLFQEMRQNSWGSVTIDTNPQSGTASILAEIDVDIFSEFYDVPLNIGMLDFNSTLGFGLDSINVSSGTPELIRSPGGDAWEYEIRMGRGEINQYQQLSININGLSGSISDEDFIIDNWLVREAYGIDSPMLVSLMLPSFGYNSIGAPSTLHLFAGSASPVPEPTTILLSGIGLLGMGAYIRRKNNNYS